MEYSIKVDILNKISKLVLLYATHSRAKKYIIKKKLNDDNIYEVFFLEENKMFEHSSQFTSNKKFLIDRRGNRKKKYYDAIDSYFKENHVIYYTAKSIAHKLINRTDDFVPEDLELLNSMYRTLKSSERKDAKKK
jgi:hypothetical protein